MPEALQDSAENQAQDLGSLRIRFNIELSGKEARDFLSYKERLFLKTNTSAGYSLVVKALRQSSTAAA